MTILHIYVSFMFSIIINMTEALLVSDEFSGLLQRLVRTSWNGMALLLLSLSVNFRKETFSYIVIIFSISILCIWFKSKPLVRTGRKQMLVSSSSPNYI